MNNKKIEYVECDYCHRKATGRHICYSVTLANTTGGDFCSHACCMNYLEKVIKIDKVYADDLIYMMNEE
ncbi:MAG: hypothetical protein J6565_08105 [Lactobacillus sp.]|nr:hypothetical protein [Lactobacillus sp.]